MKRSSIQKDELQVNVSTLKAKLSYYLGMVKKGYTCTITDHRLPIASVLPFKEKGSKLNSTPPKRNFSKIARHFMPVKIDFKVKVDSTTLLLEDRGRRP